MSQGGRLSLPTATGLASAFVLVALTVVWAWWALEQGAWFAGVMYPGVLVLCLVAALILPVPASRWVDLRRARSVRIAVWALFGLGAWSVLSALWSPAPNVALADGQRILGYGLAFVLGIWLATLLGERRHLAMAPLALAGLFTALVTAITLLGADDPTRYLDNGTLAYPLGYRNANAAFFLIALWPALGLAMSSGLAWWLRGLALGSVTLCIELALLSQSRGSIIAIVVALAVFLVVSRERAKGAIWLLLAAAAAAVVAPGATDLYQAARQEDANLTADMHAAGLAVLLGGGIATALGGITALLSAQVQISERRQTLANRVVAAAAVCLVIAGVASFAIATKDPVDWISERAEEFRADSTPDLSEASSRFALNAGSERYELWRIAVESVRDEPLTGVGPGAYQYEYLSMRGDRGVESVRDAHSVEFEIASELGLVGLALFLLAVGGAVVGAVRARASGSGAAALSACALAAGAYWLTHASIDWFWPYPAVTAPALALLGAACAPRVGAVGMARPGRGRRVGAVLALGLALSVIPFYLSDRYLNDALSSWRVEPAEAEESLDRARALNPFSEDPLLAEGAIARERGNDAAAIEAFEEAVEMRPEAWAPHYFLARLHRRERPARAREELARALELNPRSRRLNDLRERWSGSG